MLELETIPVHKTSGDAASPGKMSQTEQTQLAREKERQKCGSSGTNLATDYCITNNLREAIQIAKPKLIPLNNQWDTV